MAEIHHHALSPFPAVKIFLTLSAQSPLQSNLNKHSFVRLIIMCIYLHKEQDVTQDGFKFIVHNWLKVIRVWWIPPVGREIRVENIALDPKAYSR